MKVCHTIEECRAERAKLGQVAFVPTMGALHEGHVSLMHIASEHAQHVAVSIFVNPTQFGPNEDFHKYPRPIERDLELCRAAGVELVFNPTVEAMYPANSPGIVLDLPGLTGVLEGAHRPGHFSGVCQVVAKLFHIVQPQAACFGMKDFQQLAVLKAMVRALDFPIEMVSCPTVREPDGLAMSSRNRYLSADERRRALSISRALFTARDAIAGGAWETAPIVEQMRRTILEAGEHPEVPVSIDYVAAVDPTTLAAKPTSAGGLLLAVAARVGTTRLIDNVLVE